MKPFVFSIFLAISFSLTAQNYQPFSSASSLLYAVPQNYSQTYSVDFDSVIQNGSELYYFNHTALGSFYQTNLCPYWGPPTCWSQDKPRCLGKKVISQGNMVYRFINAVDDTITLELGLHLNDSALMYKDSLNEFWLKYQSKIVDTILGYPDSLKVFLLKHYDSTGNVISYVFHNDSILLGKNTGLVKTVRFDQFPATHPLIKLIAHKILGLGPDAITYERLYDHQPGDEIQVEKVQFSYIYGYQTHKYTTDYFLQRVNTPDSIIYTVRREIFNQWDSILSSVDTITLRYYRFDTLAALPYNRIRQSGNLELYTLNITNYCGLPLWTYAMEREYLYYCAVENSWCYYDSGPPPDVDIVYVAGLGLYQDQSISSYPNGGSSINNIIYFKKNGVSCGNQLIVGREEILSHTGSLELYPNPAVDVVWIDFNEMNNSLDFGEIQVWNTSGTLVKQNSISPSAGAYSMDISSLLSGLYLVRVVNDKGVYSSKLIIRK